MLFNDNVVAHRQAKPSTFPRRLGCEERVEYFLLDLIRYAGAIIANTDFNLVSQVLGRGEKHRLEPITGFHFAFRCGVESVRYQIEHNSRYLLRKEISHTGGGVEITMQSDIEACLFCTS